MFLLLRDRRKRCWRTRDEESRIHRAICLHGALGARSLALWHMRVHEECGGTALARPHRVRGTSTWDGIAQPETNPCAEQRLRRPRRERASALSAVASPSPTAAPPANRASRSMLANEKRRRVFFRRFARSTARSQSRWRFFAPSRRRRRRRPRLNRPSPRTFNRADGGKKREPPPPTDAAAAADPGMGIHLLPRFPPKINLNSIYRPNKVNSKLGICDG